MINLKRRSLPYPSPAFILTLRRAILKQAGDSRRVKISGKSNLTDELAVCRFADHDQDGEKLMTRKHIAEQTQFPECMKFATRDAMTL
jgi:hypothetical protein